VAAAKQFLPGGEEGAPDCAASPAAAPAATGGLDSERGGAQQPAAGGRLTAAAVAGSQGANKEQRVNEWLQDDVAVG
jgi:hypothetical protein